MRTGQLDAFETTLVHVSVQNKEQRWVTGEYFNFKQIFKVLARPFQVPNFKSLLCFENIAFWLKITSMIPLGASSCARKTILWSTEQWRLFIKTWF